MTCVEENSLKTWKRSNRRGQLTETHNSKTHCIQRKTKTQFRSKLLKKLAHMYIQAAFNSVHITQNVINTMHPMVLHADWVSILQSRDFLYISPAWGNTGNTSSHTGLTNAQCSSGGYELKAERTLYGATRGVRREVQIRRFRLNIHRYMDMCKSTSPNFNANGYVTHSRLDINTGCDHMASSYDFLHCTLCPSASVRPLYILMYTLCVYNTEVKNINTD